MNELFCKLKIFLEFAKNLLEDKEKLEKYVEDLKLLNELDSYLPEYECKFECKVLELVVEFLKEYEKLIRR